MASVCLDNVCVNVLADMNRILQHGVPRGSGVQPATDQDWRKEQQKINDYKGLVNSVNEKVCNSSRCPRLYSWTSRFERISSPWRR